MSPGSSTMDETESLTPTWKQRFKYDPNVCPNPNFFDNGTVLVRVQTREQKERERERDREEKLW
jgi:hypothetical protein